MTLSGALIAITSDQSKLVDHYERDAPILNATAVKRIVDGAKCLDEMDAEGLAELVDRQMGHVAYRTLFNEAGWRSSLRHPGASYRRRA